MPTIVFCKFQNIKFYNVYKLVDVALLGETLASKTCGCYISSIGLGKPLYTLPPPYHSSNTKTQILRKRTILRRQKPLNFADTEKTVRPRTIFPYPFKSCETKTQILIEKERFLTAVGSNKFSGAKKKLSTLFIVQPPVC